MLNGKAVAGDARPLALRSKPNASDVFSFQNPVNKTNFLW